MRLLSLLIGLLVAAASPALAQKRIAFSFDDVPRHAGASFTPDERTAALIEALQRGGVRQAGFFVTTSNLDKPFGVGGEARIAAYAAAGHVIANHSADHPALSRTPVEEYVAGIDRAEAWLATRAGHRPWFRHPYLDEAGRQPEKRQAVLQALRERGLRNAYVTIDNYDWHLDGIAARAIREGERVDMEALRDLYVETLVDTANFYERIGRESLGRSPTHVLLLHETDLAALFVDDLALALRADGWTIVPIDVAYADPISMVEPNTWLLGEGRVAALAHLAGRQPRDLVHERTDEAVLTQLFETRVLRRAAPK
jgi:peptidoglycan/xylan/chitin deacetylase (PgdA/CDA1 family)